MLCHYLLTVCLLAVDEFHVQMMLTMTNSNGDIGQKRVHQLINEGVNEL